MSELIETEITKEQQILIEQYEKAKLEGEKVIVLNGLQKNNPTIKAKGSNGLKYSEQDDRDAYKAYITQVEIDKTKKKYYNRGKEDKFIWIIYTLYQEINKHEEILTSSDLTRLIYISTFVDWKGRLMETEQTAMTKEKLKEKLRLSRNKFYELYKKLIDLQILIEYIDKENKTILYYINSDYFYKGKIDNIESISNQQKCTRLFTKEIQYLYENTTIKSHKTLSVLFRTIPYLNVKYNIVCKNPDEVIADLIKPMTLKELGEILCYSEKGIQNLRKEFTNIKTTSNKSLIIFATADGNLNHYKIIINPKVIYGGKDYKIVEGVGTLF
jgi:hypothetical protein